MTKQKVMVALKRVYDESAPGDGTRVLVERLWPRGLSRERAHIDLWLKEIAPSRELRTWFGAFQCRCAARPAAPGRVTSTNGWETRKTPAKGEQLQ